MKIPCGIASTSIIGFSGHGDVVESMGWRFLSVRQGVNEIAGHWERASKKYKCGKSEVQIARMYSSEGFVGCNDPMEPVLFPIGVEMQKEGEKSPS